MALMASGAVGPFHKMDRSSVLGALKSTGSQDRDVLHAQKEQLLAPYKNNKFVGMALIVLGALLSLTIVGALIGIPAVLGGIWLYRFTAKNIRVVEGAFAEYVGTAAAATA